MWKKPLLTFGIAIPMSVFAQVAINEASLGDFEARHIGPARMSGRIAAIDASVKDDKVVWVGTAGGGVWKSINQGTTFKSVFDKYTQSIGAVCIDQQHPDTVWVGTGESWTRNSTSVGTGIFVTTDGGKEWTHKGLSGTERISRIVIDPRNSSTIYVAALGPLWSDGEERGVYKSIDGGNTWKRVLFTNVSSGAADLVIDPQHPDILYAAMWDFRRTAYSFRSGGPGSGLYRSTDGGETWTELMDGLPEGTLGRIAISASPVSPYYVYALIESDKSALYRSSNQGKNWEMINSTTAMGERPFYFSNIYADPVDSNRVFKPGFITLMSTDAGKNFSSVAVEGGNYHVDHHALWVSPANNQTMYVGTDGGVYISVDRGNTWRHAQNLPVSQFYEVGYDMQEPYRVYGGLQDNGSWTGPSASPGGIQNADWETVGYGDGFHCYPDREDPNLVYWQYQGGRLYRTDKRNGDSKFIKPFPDGNSGDLRYNWNTPLIFSKKGPAMYVGAQYVYRTTDKGDTWQRISGDLTTNNPVRQQQEQSGGVTIDNSTAENNTTVVSIAESPLNASVIWAGTDDGNLWVTRDGGKLWTKLNDKLPGFPADAVISHIDASNFMEGEAFVTIDAHRQGDMKPYAYRTTDFGVTWSMLTSEGVEGYCHVIKQDLVQPDLLFLGSEFGLYLSFDRGASWIRFTNKVPPVGVFDLEIHPREHDLILGTHGRGIVIIDDIRPWRSLTPAMLEKDFAFLPSEPFQFSIGGIAQDFPGDQEFVGRNANEGAYISYYMKKRHLFGDMYVELFDAQGKSLQQMPAGKRKGINKVTINTSMKPPKIPVSGVPLFQAAFGPDLPAGTYQVKVVKGDSVYTTSITLEENPSFPYTAADRAARQEALLKAYQLLEELAYLDERIKEVKIGADRLALILKDQKAVAMAKSVSQKMDDLHEKIAATQPGEGAITGQVRLREQIAEVYSALGSYNGPPAAPQMMALDVYRERMEKLETDWRNVMNKDVGSLNQQALKQNVPPIQVSSKEDFFNK